MSTNKRPADDLIDAIFQDAKKIFVGEKDLTAILGDEAQIKESIQGSLQEWSGISSTEDKKKIVLNQLKSNAIDAATQMIREMDATNRELEETNRELEETNRELEQNQRESAATIRKLGAKNRKLGATNRKLGKATVRKVLSLNQEELDQYKLQCMGNLTSNINTSHDAAECTTKEFPILPKVVPDNRLNSFKAEPSSLMPKLLAIGEKSPLYWNEYDVHNLVQAAIEDAVLVLNRLFEPKTGDARIVLAVRREARLDSNLLDHSVVFDKISNIPVFEVETKKPVHKTLDLADEKMKSVHGQIFDQLAEMKAFGHPNPIAALTTFDETRIVWIQTNSINKVLEEAETSNINDFIKKVLQNFGKNTTKDPNLTPSPIKLKPAKGQGNRRTQRDTGITFKPAQRQIFMSTQRLALKEMVDALAKAILCGMVNFHKMENSIEKLRDGTELGGRPALRVMPNKDEWGGSSKKENEGALSWGNIEEGMVRESPDSSNCKAPFYILDFLGAGSTSRAYRAIDANGRECVLKFYVRRYDNNMLLSPKQFGEDGLKAVEEEVANYHKIYPEIKHLVSAIKVKDIHCVVHPFFIHTTDRSAEVLEEIGQCLDDHFKETPLGFWDDDIAWRHVGRYDDKVYLFDLADLKPPREEGWETYKTRHIEELRRRAAGATEAGATESGATEAGAAEAGAAEAGATEAGSDYLSVKTEGSLEERAAQQP